MKIELNDEIKREYILDEIRRTADENEGNALGRQKFEAATGIRKHDWLGKYWTRWGDAIEEAGLQKNQLQQAFSKDEILKIIAEFIRDHRKFPTEPELRLARKNDPSFPSHNTFASHLGNRANRARLVVSQFKNEPEFAEAVEICQEIIDVESDVCLEETGCTESADESSWGFVYLIRYGKDNIIKSDVP